MSDFRSHMEEKEGPSSEEKEGPSSEEKEGPSSEESFHAETPDCHTKRVSRERQNSPTSSDVSLKSEQSMGYPINFGNRDQPAQRIQQNRKQSPSLSLTSLKRDESCGYPGNYGTDDKESQGTQHSPTSSDVSLKSEQSMGYPINFGNRDQPAQRIQQNRKQSPSLSLTSLKRDESCGYPGNYGTDDKSEFTHTTASFQEIHKECMMAKFELVSEGPSPDATPTLLKEIYTDLYITEGGGGEVNDEHEVREIEKAARTAATEETPISCNDIFKPLPGQDQPIRRVLTVGVAGIGKTVSVQKFILDWAEGIANQDVHFIFPLPFRELNLMKEKKLSLLNLIQKFLPEITDARIFMHSEHRVMFIFDGLDECRLPLDFHSNRRCCDVTEPASVDMLLTNLIKGNLLPSALFWITTRPAAANQIPPEFIDQVTEIRGFGDLQKEEYMKKRIRDENLARRTISHLRSSRSLYIMCHIPVFCRISATVLDRMLSKTECVEMPRTLTQVYIHYLLIQTSIKKEKYREREGTDDEMIFKLGKLAFQQLEEGNLIFYEEDLRECGIDVTEASVYSGVCTQIFREEPGLYQGKVFSFVHLSIQEFLAALYVFLCFSNRERNMPDQQQTSQLSALFRAATLHDLHKTAVDLALQSKNGHLDLFLRFLLGISLESNQKLLHELMKYRSISMTKKKTVEHIKSNILECHPVEKNLNLLHCLSELGDTSMVENMQRSLISGRLPWSGSTAPTLHQCTSLLYLLLTAAEGQYDFHPNKVIKTDQCVAKMLPLIKVSRTARLSRCSLTARSCELLVPVLIQRSTLVRHLDLSGNQLGDAGVRSLSEALTNPKCKLQSLWLRSCSLAEGSCSILASVLSPGSSLSELDLSGNRVQDAGVKLLAHGLNNTHCTLQVLRLNDCGLTDESCAYLASALRSNPSHLRELHLSYNTVGEPGEKLLEALLKDPRCRLEKLANEQALTEQLVEMGGLC